MNNYIIELIKTGISLLTPIVLLYLGLKINRNLEKKKIDLSKEKEWQIKWADAFYDIAVKFNDLVTTCVIEMHNVASIGNSSDPEKDNLIKEKSIIITSAIHNLQRMDWEIRNYMQFCPKSANDVTSLQAKLFLLLNTLISEKKGDLEDIRKAQFDFNEAVRRAHGEIMAIKPSIKVN